MAEGASRRKKTPDPPTIVTTKDRVDLVPVVAQWLWNAFWQTSGKSFDQLLEAAHRSSRSTAVIPQTFVLLSGDEPVGTASLIGSDLESRPDLSPWLAGVFVTPAHRGRGLAALLVRAAEDAARNEHVSPVWLHTKSAERVYARLGWRRVGFVQDGDRLSALMRRDLTQLR